METGLKSCLKAIVLELRRELEGFHDASGAWHPGDLERRLGEIGVWRDRPSKPADELAYRTPEDRDARRVVDAYVKSHVEAGLDRGPAIAELVREAAYTWANRLLALRCMEARGLIDEVILQKDTYGGRSLQHHRLAKRAPERCADDDEGLFAVLQDEFERRAVELPLLFDPRAPEVALRPSVQAIKNCVAKLSGTDEPKGRAKAADEVFTAPDAAGWAYQYWNTEEKDRVFENARPPKRAKITGADIIPATCIYTEPYMVKFLVQNALGAMWMGMRPSSRLCDTWDYFVRDADRTPVAQKAVREIAFLDPACGSGHFLLEAFDLFFEMYREEGELRDPAAICATILEHNLFGIDIDERAVQIAAFALVMKAKEKAPDFVPRQVNLVATNIRLPATKEHLDAFLLKHPEDAQLRPALIAIFEGLAHADELGSLLQLEEPVEKELRALKAKYEAAGSPPEQRALWPEYQKPVQGKLPIGVATYGEWKERALARIREHFDADAQSTDLGAAFFGEAGAKGVSVVDVLSHRYDVVAGNPPYMGSKNMGPVLKKYVERHFAPGKRDLYAAFILRCLELTAPGGRVTMVMPQSWMFNSTYAGLRAYDRGHRGLLRTTTFEALAQLGRHAFSEADPPSNVVLATFAAVAPSSNHRISCFRLAAPMVAEEQADLLGRAVAGSASSICFRPKQSHFLSIPLAPISFWLRDRFFQILAGATLEATSKVVQQVITSNNSRFLRFAWERPATQDDWIGYLKAGGYGKWCGFDHVVLNWRWNGAAIKNAILERYPYLSGNVGWLIKEDTFWLPGWTYTHIARGCLGVRRVDSGYVCDSSSPMIVLKSEHPGLGAVLNCRVTSFFLRSLTTDIGVREGYINRIPIPDGPSAALGGYEHAAVALKRLLLAPLVTERSYVPDWLAAKGSLLETFLAASQRAEEIATLLHSVEGASEREVFRSFGIVDDDLASVLAETGVPAGWFPLIEENDALPGGFEGLLPDFQLRPHIEFVARRKLTVEELAARKKELRTLYEAGAGDLLVDDSETPAWKEEAEEESETHFLSSILRPLPAETFLEEFSQKLEIHPISVYWLLQELREQDHVVSRPELVRFVEDYASVLVLRLLGHRWPRQVEAAHALPEWADRDGIIPITEGAEEATLIVRVRERLAADFGAARASIVEREFEEIIGRPLATWLGLDFFKRHISQFRKRPIAWQLRSTPAGNERRRGRGAVRNAPAFSCLVYYHRVDDDLVPKLRSQYIGPLRARLQTELGGLERLKERTLDQDARRVELEAKIEELCVFDARLEEVIVGSFDSDALETILAEEPLDKWTSRDGRAAPPTSSEALLVQERRYDPDLNDGVRVNIAPLQRAGLLAADVLASKDVEKAITDRAEWRADERRWCRDGKLPQPGWWPAVAKALELPAMPNALPAFEPAHEAALFVWALLHASGGPVARTDVARAFALRSQPAVLRKFAPPELRIAAQAWADRIGQRTVAAGLLATALTDLAGRDGIRLTSDGQSRSIVTTGGHTPPEDQVDDWFRFEARLALGVLAALPAQHLQELDAGIAGEDRKLLAAGAA